MEPKIKTKENLLIERKNFNEDTNVDMGISTKSGWRNCKSCYDLSRTLYKDGHDVTVITYREGDAPYFEDDKGVKGL